jgi:hypothetical protein
MVPGMSAIRAALHSKLASLFRYITDRLVYRAHSLVCGLFVGESSRNRRISAGCAPEWNWSSAPAGTLLLHQVPDYKVCSKWRRQLPQPGSPPNTTSSTERKIMPPSPFESGLNTRDWPVISPYHSFGRVNELLVFST